MNDAELITVLKDNIKCLSKASARLNESYMRCKQILLTTPANHISVGWVNLSKDITVRQRATHGRRLTRTLNPYC